MTAQGPGVIMATANRCAGCIVYCAVVVAFASIWHWKVTGGLSLTTLLAFALIAGLSFVYGSVFLGSTALPVRTRSSLNVRFLCGYLCVNTLLFASTMALPLPIAGNLAIVAIFGVVLLAWRRSSLARSVEPRRAPELLALLLSATAATVWCSDGLEPLVRDGSNTIFRLWGDSWVHARFISSIAQAHGLATLSDIRMSGTPVYLYHYASYAVPAALSAITDSGTYEIYASFLLPFGILLTGIAAFSLGRFLWGAWPGVAATVAIVLIPDAYQQGFGNKYLSYNFMQQVNLAGLYGVACVTLAWIFVLDGCRRANPRSIAVGWVIAAFVLFYKAHVFVANAFLILVYPCLFFPTVRMRWRFAFGAGLVILFFAAGSLSVVLDRAPTIRLDGSGALTYMQNLAWNYDPGFPGSYFDKALRQQQPSTREVLLYGTALLLVSTLGWWTLVAAAVGFSIRGKTPRPVLLFPLLVVVNYLVMALGLALDTKGIGSPDELLNRPLVWAYFAVATWSGAAVYFVLFGNHLPTTRVGRLLVACVLLASLGGPILHSTNLQTYPRWKGFETYAIANSVPTCLVSASRYIRDHSRPDELIQDSENDTRFIVAGMAERQAFTTYADNRPPDEIYARVRDLAAWKKMTGEAEIKQFAAQRGIVWYLLRPSTDIAWPPSIIQSPVFECAGYRVFRLDR
jgi:hypothetical protein